MGKVNTRIGQSRTKDTTGNNKRNGLREESKKKLPAPYRPLKQVDARKEKPKQFSSNVSSAIVTPLDDILSKKGERPKSSKEVMKAQKPEKMSKGSTVVKTKEVKEREMSEVIGSTSNFARQRSKKVEGKTEQQPVARRREVHSPEKAAASTSTATSTSSGLQIVYKKTSVDDRRFQAKSQAPLSVVAPSRTSTAKPRSSVPGLNTMPVCVWSVSADFARAACSDSLFQLINHR